MARDLAMCRVFTGRIVSDPSFTEFTMGPHPSAWATYMRVGTSGIRSRRRNSCRPFQILVMRAPPPPRSEGDRGGVARDAGGARRDGPPGDDAAEGLVIVFHLQRPEAELADVE